MRRGFLIAAPSSGAGKTTVTLGLLRAFQNQGYAVQGAKSGPDYIDPRFHEAASGATCFNLDAWAMSRGRLLDLASDGPEDLLVVEGAMGLFDGAASGGGSAADLARILGLPVILVVDAAKMAQSVAPLVAGFAAYDPAVTIAGVILNNVGSERHAQMLGDALRTIGVPLIGALPRSNQLSHPERHLGLVQACDRDDLETFLARVADLVGAHMDLAMLADLAEPFETPPLVAPALPPAQRIAVARDEAFAFCYPHLLRDWRRAGAELSFFSPLADEAPGDADFIFLPGGYPELHAGRLAANQNFLAGLRRAAGSARIYGECGGYMALGDGLIDADGRHHAMAGLLRLETSFQLRKRHLGYRILQGLRGPFQGQWAAHEFHYSTQTAARGEPLFAATDALGSPLEPQGLVDGTVSGSYMHLIDRL